MNNGGVFHVEHAAASFCSRIRNGRIFQMIVRNDLTRCPRDKNAHGRFLSFVSPYVCAYFVDVWLSFLLLATPLFHVEHFHYPLAI